MKRVVVVFSLVLLLFACEGKQGPMGPAGPSGASMVTVTGIVARADYVGDCIRIYSDFISEHGIVHVYMTSDPVHYSWQLVSDIYIYPGRISVHDPEMDYLGYYYEIKIIPDNSSS